MQAIWLLACISWCSGLETVHSNGTAALPSTTATVTATATGTRHGASSGRARNDHDEIKSLINHVVDGVMQKIDVSQAIYVNELSSMADVIIGSFGQSLRELNARMQTLEFLSHQIDELTDYKNTVDTKLYRFSEHTEAIQMLNVRMTELQQNIDYVRTQMDQVIERTLRQPKSAHKVASSSSMSAAGVSDAESTLASGEQNAANCESKIDQVISFVHNFAEINRLESSDILNRLSNIQTQLILFFDADKVSVKSHIYSNSREKVLRNKSITCDEHVHTTTEAIQTSLVSAVKVLMNNVTNSMDDFNGTVSSDNIQMK